MQRHGFTLIELLVVVGIIAILASLAVPNFLEARTRSVVSRARADMRTLAIGLEAYAADNNTYPAHGELLSSGLTNLPAKQAGLGTVEFTPGQPLTTPIAYLTSLPEDPFLTSRPPGPARLYGYINSKLMRDILLGRGLENSAVLIEPMYGGWRIYGAGPDGDKGGDAKLNILYDPTNGTVSDGDLLRTQRNPEANWSQDER